MYSLYVYYYYSYYYLLINIFVIKSVLLLLVLIINIIYMTQTLKLRPNSVGPNSKAQNLFLQTQINLPMP